MNKHVAKKPVGRPTKYDLSILPKVEAWCQMGATIEQIAAFLEVDRVTLYRWASVHPEFCDAIRAGKERADALVERTLYERALAGEAWAVNKWLNNRMPREWGGKPADQPSTVTSNTLIDPRRIMYEQLDDASLGAIANLRRIASARPG